MFTPGSASTPSKAGFSPETDFQHDTLTNDGFWPDVNLADFQQNRSIPVDIPADLIKGALLAAVNEVNDALKVVRNRHQAQGVLSAKDVKGPAFGDINALCAQYQKAVFARAKADLMGEFTSLSHKGQFPNQEGRETRDTLLAEASVVMRNIKGRKRVGVHLL